MLMFKYLLFCLLTVVLYGVFAIFGIAGFVIFIVLGGVFAAESAIEQQRIRLKRALREQRLEMLKEKG